MARPREALNPEKVFWCLNSGIQHFKKQNLLVPHSGLCLPCSFLGPARALHLGPGPFNPNYGCRVPGLHSRLRWLLFLLSVRAVSKKRKLTPDKPDGQPEGGSCLVSIPSWPVCNMSNNQDPQSSWHLLIIIGP